MRALFIGAALLAALPAQAAIYKCPGQDGQVVFSDKPCGGAAESPEHQVEVAPPKPANSPGQGQAEADAKWEEQKRYRYVEVPRMEREAAGELDDAVEEGIFAAKLLVLDRLSAEVHANFRINERVFSLAHAYCHLPVRIVFPCPAGTSSGGRPACRRPLPP